VFGGAALMVRLTEHAFVRERDGREGGREGVYDTLIRGGLVVDPSQGIHAAMDVAIAGGRLAALEEAIPEGEAREVVDARGRIVTPGLIDIHTHLYWGVSHYGADADENCVSKGVTTAIEAGSAGAQSFPGLRRYVIERSHTRILPLLNISSIGMAVQAVGELEELRYADRDHARRVVEENRDLIIGMKVRLSTNVVGSNCLEPFKLALEVASDAGIRVMVHIGDTEAPLEEILPVLRAGDILTHTFHGRGHPILDDKGNVLPVVRAAQERGVVLDVGHGQRSFSFPVMQRSLEQGILPTTISSDVHAYDIEGPVFDQATTLSKFLMLGLSLDDVIERSTAVPARVMGMEREIGTLRVGAEGDVAVWDLREGEFTFEDSYQNTLTGRQKLEPVVTLKAGKVFWPVE